MNESLPVPAFGQPDLPPHHSHDFNGMQYVHFVTQKVMDQVQQIPGIAQQLKQLLFLRKEFETIPATTTYHFTHEYTAIKTIIDHWFHTEISRYELQLLWSVHFL